MRMARVLVDGAARVTDQFAIAEVGVQALICGAQEPRSGRTRERDDVLVIRDAATGGLNRSRLCLNFFLGNQPHEACLRPCADYLSSSLDRLEFVKEAATDYQHALSVVDPLPEREEFRVGRTVEEAASHIGIDDGAHLSRRRGSGAARRGRSDDSPPARR